MDAKIRRPSSSWLAIMPSGGRTTFAQGSRRRRFALRPMDELNYCQLRRLAAVRRNSTRQRNSMLMAPPWRRQTCAMATPGFSVSCTIARFCSSLKRRRFRRPIHRVRRQAVFASRNEQRCLIGLGHSDEAGIASPFRRRILPCDCARSATHAATDQVRRHTPHAPGRSSSSPRHACSRMPAERSGRCPCACRSDSVEASWAASAAPSCANVLPSSGANSAAFPHVCADHPRSPDGASTARMW